MRAATKRGPRRSQEPGLDVDAEQPLPKWVSEQLIVCGHGPLMGLWFTATDWEARKRAQQRMRDVGSTSAWGALDYTVTIAEEPHPVYPSIMGRRAVYQARGQQ